MSSVVVDRPNSMAVVERPLPEPGPGEVGVRVRFAGSCGSDLHIFHGMNPFVLYPRIIGHELVGRIGAVGEGVGRSSIGETVVVDPVIGCGQCHACRIGRQDVCSRLQVIGVHRDGGFSQYVCAPEKNAHVVPAGLALPSASVIEPFAVAANVTHRTGVPPSDIALVYGAGPTLIYDAVCHPSILEEAVRIAAPAGRIGVLGFSNTPSAIPQQELTKKELTLYASRLNCAMFPTVIDWISRGRVDPGRIITHQVDFRDLRGAFDIAERNPRESCKVLLDFGADR